MISANDSEYTYIPIFATNDIHGNFFPRIIEVNETFSYKRGGLEFFGKYLEIMRKEFGQERVIWLDAGDQHTGGAELQLSDNQILTDFMNSAKITAATIGNHEYDLHFEPLKKKMENSSFPYIAGNILNNNTLEFYPISEGTTELNGHKKYIVKEIKINNEDTIKIGIIGVGSVMNYVEGTNKVNSSDFQNMTWKDYAESIKDLVKEIKEKYPDLNSIIGVIHQSTICENPLELDLYTKDTLQGKCEDSVEKDGHLIEILNSIGPGLLDAVIGGHTHLSVHHWINDIPVTSVLTESKVTNILYLPFKKVEGKYQLVKEQIKIEGPLPNCEKVFTNNYTCLDESDGTITDKEGEGENASLLSFSYRGEKIQRSSYVSEIYKKYYPEFKEYTEDEIARLYGMTGTLNGRDFSGDAYLINLMLDIIKNETQADIAIMNGGVFRTQWTVGKITKEKVLAMCPFENFICTTKIKGSDLKTIIEIIQKGIRKYYPTSGLKQIISVDKDGNPKVLKELSLWVNGEENQIDDNKEYTLSSTDYMLKQYGDDFAKILEVYFFENVQCEDRTYGDVILDGLLKLKNINITSYKDLEHPRLILERNINDGYALVSADDPDYTYIPIFGTNDMHSFVFPRITEINENLSYKRAGLEFFSKYLEIIRNEFGEDRVIWLDGGDQHTGGAELELSNNEIMTDFMNDAKITGPTIGNHEYDLHFEALKEKIKKSNFPYLAANILNNNTHEFYPIAEGTTESNGHKKYIVKEIALKNGDIIKIGIIGIGAVMSYESGENYVDEKDFKNMEWKDLAESVKDTVKEIKEEHTDLNSIIAVIHSGTKCGQQWDLNLYTKDNPKEECQNEELMQVLNSLETGLLDAVVSGDVSVVIQNWINGMPVISGLDNGQITNILYLPFKKQNGKYEVVKDQVKIEGPLPNCEKIFFNTKTCMNVSTEEEYEKAGSLYQFTYRGVKMERSSYMSSIYEKYYPTFKEYSEVEIARLYGMKGILAGKDRSGDGYLSNLFIDLLRKSTSADVAIINAGAFRTSWTVGKITKADIKSMFPFDSLVCTTKIKGADLKMVVEIVQKGEKKYYPTSGLKQTISVDNDGNPLELKELAQWINGAEVPIEDEKIYSLCSVDYVLLEYGDDFKDVVPYYSFNDTYGVECGDTPFGDIIQEGIVNLKNIDITSYVDPKHPRLVKIQN